MKKIISMITACAFLATLGACDFPSDNNKTESASGVNKAEVKVPVGSNGLTTEQTNVQRRLLEDNKPGALKHLYVISAYSGQVILYSTVKGKVTSSGKRLNPTSVSGYTDPGTTQYYRPFRVAIGDQFHMTNEVLQDDGTYGSSVEYIYWWDQNDRYHQHYVSGGQIIHVSSQPMSVKSIIINNELVKEDGSDADDVVKDEPKKLFKK